MNERIRELAKQADEGYTGNSRDDMGDSLVGNDAIEKFAESIVKQCIHEMLHECVMNPASSIHVQDFMIVVAKRIQTRFGIEE